MTRDDLVWEAAMLFGEATATLIAGQEEYADAANPFANFERAADRLGLRPEEVLGVFVLKHIDGIMAWIRGHRQQRDSLRGRIIDAINYLALLAVMCGQGKENEDGSRAEERGRASVAGVEAVPVAGPQDRGGEWGGAVRGTG